MMPYQSYQLHQAARPKTAAEIRRADDQLGRMAEKASWVWHRATQPLTLLLGAVRRVAGPALLDASR